MRVVFTDTACMRSVLIASMLLQRWGPIGDVHSLPPCHPTACRAHTPLDSGILLLGWLIDKQTQVATVHVRQTHGSCHLISQGTLHSSREHTLSTWQERSGRVQENCVLVRAQCVLTPTARYAGIRDGKRQQLADKHVHCCCRWTVQYQATYWLDCSSSRPRQGVIPSWHY